ncbi:MAG: [protein-PII] uridylyltransferase, partial [Burkholderiaceae bacterium]
MSRADRRRDYAAAKAELLAPVKTRASAARVIRSTLRQMSTLADEALCTVWHDVGLDTPFALVAVGGFGRGELFPHSDVDVLLLLPDGAEPGTDAELTARLEAFVTGCWDVGLEIGSSVRSIDDCLVEAEKDLTVQTSLLDSRLVVGDSALFDEFRTRFSAALDPQAFFIGKTLEMRQRHSKYEDTPYALEPNCKESPGGLRDLQVILWVAKAAGFGTSWDDLAANGLATPFEVRQLKRNESLLSLIRSRLHLLARRREDRLVFDLQTAVAESFGFHSVTPGGQRLPIRASEALMRRYYWAAKAVTQLTRILMLNIEERLGLQSGGVRRINARFNARADLIEVESDDLYIRDPHAILETFLLFQTHVVRGFSARTLRALYNARHVMDDAFRADWVNHATFMQILRQRSGITHVLRLMNQTSVLGRYLWAFRGIVGQMQHDLFHVYTVDQHCLMVVRNMRRFFMAEHAHEYPFCSELAERWDKPWLLYVAALFHDIGKGRGGDHSELGARDAVIFCEQHGIGLDDTRLIEFLILHHLSMSRVAQKEDLSNPAVVAAFAELVADERRLTALYLLTVADIRGTSPK